MFIILHIMYVQELYLILPLYYRLLVFLYLRIHQQMFVDIITRTMIKHDIFYTHRIIGIWNLVLNKLFNYIHQQNNPLKSHSHIHTYSCM